MQTHRLLLPAIMCFCCAGCSSDESGVDTHPVSGTVTYKSQPATGVLLTFFAQDGEGVNAQAISDDAGEFTVSTSFDMGRQDQAGMVAGNYKVTATKMETPNFGEAGGAPKNLLPPQYAKPQTSPLTATVVPGEENQIVLDLD